MLETKAVAKELGVHPKTIWMWIKRQKHTGLQDRQGLNTVKHR